jgi:ABC-2 type transport system ATP-binding protein
MQNHSAAFATSSNSEKTRFPPFCTWRKYHQWEKEELPQVRIFLSGGLPYNATPTLGGDPLETHLLIQLQPTDFYKVSASLALLAQNGTEAAASEIAALSVVDLWKKYGNNQALSGTSLSVGRGERLALLGPNGAGKTTLIRSMCGRVRPDRGQVLLMGCSIREPDALQKMGVVPQDLAIYADLTAKQNLECFGQLHGLRGRRLRDRVAWALQWIGLEDRAHELTRGFSGGMKRRVNIACGVMHRPQILLLDEPTVGVDPQSRQRIFDMLDELNQEGTSIVLTTHHLDEAETRSDRIVIIDHGKVVADGTLEQLIESTIGLRRQVAIQTTGMLVAAPPGLDWDPTRGRFVCFVDNVVEELPKILDRIRLVGGIVTDLEVHQPDLHHVFLHLTGKELRE